MENNRTHHRPHYLHVRRRKNKNNNNNNNQLSQNRTGGNDENDSSADSALDGSVERRGEAASQGQIGSRWLAAGLVLL